jgi:hypothetical protein
VFALQAVVPDAARVFTEPSLPGHRQPLLDAVMCLESHTEFRFAQVVPANFEVVRATRLPFDR